MMKRTALMIFLGIVIFGCGTRNAEQPYKNWYKGNLHTHSYWSDGDEFPEVIMDWYKSSGYHFVALTDHNVLAEGEKWKVIRKDSIYQQAFQSYLETYGEDWVNNRIDSLGRTEVKLKTYREYKSLFEENDRFLIIQAEEITDRFEDKPLHLNTTNVLHKIDPQGGRSVVEVLQNNIDAVIRQRDSLQIPMIVHINHPNFGYAIALDDMIAISNERFFEVYNGHHLVHNMGDSTHMSTEEMWDYINIAYLHNNKPLMYGLATDDSHHYHRTGREWSNAGRGWIMVNAESLTVSKIIEAMERGSFYASTGVDLASVVFKNDELLIEVEQEEGVSYEIIFSGCRKGDAHPEVFHRTEDTKARFTLTDDLLFVRCKVTSSKLHPNPIEDLIYETAWTQPVQFNSQSN